MVLRRASHSKGGSRTVISQQIMCKLLMVRDFPTLPEVVNQVLDAVECENSSAEDLTALIEQDRVISICVLRMANAAFHGLRHRVDTLPLAVVVLGFTQVRLLALTTSVFAALSRQRQSALDPMDFWMHSLGTAKAAQILAKHCSALESAATCFTAGLIHDVGKYMLALALKDEYRAVVEAARTMQCPLREVELECLGVNSSEVGSWLAGMWHLPPGITSTIQQLPHAATYSGTDQADVVTVALADQVSRFTGYGLAGDYGETQLDPELLEAIELDSEGVSRVLEEVNGLLTETRQFIMHMEEH